jgi:hypothetical protein
LHLFDRGFSVRLTSGTTPMITGTNNDDVSGGGGDAEGLLLDALAAVQPVEKLTFEAIASTVRHGNEGMLIAVLGALTPDDTDRLIRARHGMGQSIALVCNPSSWADPNVDDSVAARRHADCLALLRTAGWTVAHLTRDVPVATSWSSLRDAAKDSSVVTSA